MSAKVLHNSLYITEPLGRWYHFVLLVSQTVTNPFLSQFSFIEWIYSIIPQIRLWDCMQMAI